MKLIHAVTVLLIALFPGHLLRAQPMIANGANMVPFGYSDSLFWAPFVASPGASGAGVTWDFSKTNPAAIYTGYYDVMRPFTTPYDCPGANYAFHTYPYQPGAAYTGYYTIDATGWYLTGEYGYMGNRYAEGRSFPNSQLMMPFPCSYGSQRTDSFVTPTTYGLLKITYDAYGTLVTPWATHNDVIRLKYEWSNGRTDYWWFTSSPLFILAQYYSGGDGQVYFYQTGHPTHVGIHNSATAQNDAVSVYPNPAKTSAAFHIKSAAAPDGACLLRDMTGRLLREIPISKGSASIERGELPAGVYFYEAYSGNALIGRGKLVFE